MTLEKAIRILSEEMEYPGSNDISKAEEAEQLGIEALKLLLHQSPNRGLPGTKLLPGETKD